MPLNSAEATNTLVVLLDRFSDAACDEVHASLAACGPLQHFARLRSFGRCLAVFSHTPDAQTALSTLHSTQLRGGNRVRLYFAAHTLLAQPHQHLDVPQHEKLWLISPPGSPPVNWRQARESPPNAAHLDRRLESALQALGRGRFVLNLADVSDDDGSTCGTPPDADVVPLDLDRAAWDLATSAGGVDSGDDSSDGSGSGLRCAPTIIIQDCNHEDDPQSRTTMADARAALPRTAPTTHRFTPRPPATAPM
ncbi:hypothetical protein LPJ61_000593 [Coemansia biformis]|uniref:Calcipressin n=1 Tax=Coemansia biformis TaxID=1286918 RepID=A0A9W7YI16_9FUNG|nr:hypothetical protein LPJ61_000593 [Coemansia biformis]